ncbi:hypothetical protein D9M69_698050 [compost metagenome]
MTPLTVDAQAHLQLRLSGAAKLVERDDPGADRRSTIHGLLGQQIKAAYAPSRVPRTDIISDRIAEQASAGLGHVT